MGALRSVPGWLWASPLTLCGFLYVTVFTALGWYKRLGNYGDAMCWQLKPSAPAWLKNKLHLHSGHTVGNVVVLDANLDTHHGRVALHHLQIHVEQAMAMGVFYPLLWTASWLSLQFCKHAHPHFDHPFEIDARRAANQTIDVIGALRKAQAEGRLKRH